MSKSLQLIAYSSFTSDSWHSWIFDLLACLYSWQNTYIIFNNINWSNISYHFISILTQSWISYYLLDYFNQFLIIAYNNFSHSHIICSSHKYNHSTQGKYPTLIHLFLALPTMSTNCHAFLIADPIQLKIGTKENIIFDQ